MIATFSTPVLSIAADAMKDLEGRDALFSLWNLFSKCKESLQDGRRLENISWRLWYREMAAAQSYRPLTPESSSPTLSNSPEEFPFFSSTREKSLHHNESSQRSLQPTRVRHISNHHQHNHSSSEKPPTPSPSPSSCLSISFGPPKSSPSVGTFIVDMLPHNAIPSLRLPPAEQHSRDKVDPVTLPAVSLPTVCLPSTPILADSVFPRVVVVNPTPHPTPPATPVLRNAASPAQLPSEHLLPPLPSPALMTLNPSPEQDVMPSYAQPSPPPGWLSKPAASPDETLVASDRRIYQQQLVEGRSPELEESTDCGKTTFSDVVEASSSHTQSKGSAESDRPALTNRTRKGKEVMRHVARLSSRRTAISRPNMKRHISMDATKHRPTFNIGSSSSNGSKGAQNGAASSSSKVTTPPPAPPKEPLPNPVKISHAQSRRIVVASSPSSEYETDSDDDSWCSEEMSLEESEKTKADTRLREAALEAQRQRDMFAKVPKRSYSNLDRSRSGLLSTLLNPDPNIFPPHHPYRTSLSSQDVTQLPRRTAVPGLTPLTPMTTSKSSAAIPQASQATAQAPLVNGTNHRPKPGVDRGYQPKGRPQNQEMEDDSDSDEDNPDDRIQVSRSVAQERLAALAGRRGIGRSHSSRPPEPGPSRPVLQTVTSAPIPFGHPYNLPAPAPPSTPRTTRRQMLASELSESLRRNLLWERQMGKQAQPKRQSATALSGALRPLTSTTAGESSTNGGSTKPSASHEGRDDRDDRKRRAMARNRSWADDYHYSGW